MGKSRVHGLVAIMEKAELFRRIFHMTAIVYLLYYLLPEELVPGFYKWYGVVIIVFITLIVEGMRIKRGALFFGLRKYEKRRMSAFAWFAIGMGIALLWFKMVFVVPVVIGMAIIDPLIGEIKRKKEELYPFLPSLIYGLIVFLCLLLISERHIHLKILFTVVATISAISAEHYKSKYIDDDFLMIVIPLFALTCFDYLLSLF